MLGFLNRFVDSNDRELKRIQPFVDEANALEPEIEALTDDEIRARFGALREEIREAAEPDEPSDDELNHPEAERRRELAADRRKRENQRIQAALDDALPESFAMTREAMKRTLGMRHFDVQLLGGIVLHQGKIAEARTGEGKTFYPTLAAVLNSMTGRGVHVVTVNDYLARRDPQWMGPVFHFLGVSVGMITHDASFVFEPGYPTSDERLVNLRPVERVEAYAADVTYGTNNEFGFDYLRDNMVVELDQRVQRERSFAIVDEVDNILIDEARTPADHQRPGRGVGRQVLHVRPARARACPLVRRATRRAATTSSTSRTRRSARPRRASTRWRSGSASRISTTRTRASPVTSSRRSGPTPCTSATATTSSRTARSSSSTSSPAARCPAGAGARASTRRSRRRRACASSARA